MSGVLGMSSAPSGCVPKSTVVVEISTQAADDGTVTCAATAPLSGGAEGEAVAVGAGVSVGAGAGVYVIVIEDPPASTDVCVLVADPR
jgi:hypothetical protein